MNAKLEIMASAPEGTVWPDDDDLDALYAAVERIAFKRGHQALCVTSDEGIERVAVTATVAALVSLTGGAV